MPNSDKVKEWRRNTKRKIILSMGEKCQCCGYDKCDAALELHHIDPNDKDISFNAIRANPKSIEIIKNELKKCILLCANCHREIHNNHRTLPDTYAILNEDILLAKKRKCPECGSMFLDLHLGKYCGKSCAGLANQKKRKY